MTLTLHAERAGTGPRLVLVHGFTQTGRCWGPLAGALAAHHEVLMLDAPGHGRSRHLRDDLDAGAARIAATGGRATYLGYSMGARFCLHVALRAPELVRALVLVGGTAGIDDADARSARAAQDRDTAARLRRDGLVAFLDDWLDQPLFAHLPAERAFRDERLDNDVEGLASSLELAGTGSQDPSWDRLHLLSMPVLAVSGALDEKFSALAARLVEYIGPNATAATIAGAGHAAHLEQPEAFLDVLLPWLAHVGG